MALTKISNEVLVNIDEVLSVLDIVDLRNKNVQHTLVVYKNGTQDRFSTLRAADFYKAIQNGGK
jgi:hypothetical protein